MIPKWLNIHESPSPTNELFIPNSNLNISSVLCEKIMFLQKSQKVTALSKNQTGGRNGQHFQGMNLNC